jgi:cytochrome c-type biogenesis protein CcmH/NrfF
MTKIGRMNRTGEGTASAVPKGPSERRALAAEGSRGFPFLLRKASAKAKRFVFLLLLLSLAISPLVAVRLAAQSDHAKQFGMKIKCMCRGCDMSAGGCSHPGGAFSGPCETAKGMMREADEHIAKGETDEQILQAFVQEYGSIVYVEPPKHGFGLVAWIMPVFYTLLGVGLVVFVMKKWRKQAIAAPATPHAQAAIDPSDAFQKARAQADRETEE